ncbi:exodeoxyribonuclease VII large subunit [Pisciglobus halotolerans]|uniref:Exodeoxyribonuclease 7 large subunit n=1 Tax=Pisciglobus halotolerans TaxID=745365 RepID=A0A1I3CWD0_9LACT|nr:exodeoxyribonuclease VII large subunit [Pisciglobus halotolerans]SFH78765.1 Exodeoxyribonuclease VII large subunit [Pisciglobus halotolerans]
MTNEYLTVSALTKYLKRKFDADPYLGRVYLTGEISNFRYRANTHQYFSLKDQKAVISATMFKSSFSKLKFTPEEGMKVLVIGRITLYEPSGRYQINIEHMEPDGVGALYQALEEMKKKLSKEGLFTAPKQLLPTFPKRIAVITSPSGAVIRDIMTTVKRRFPIVQLVVFPTQVQGKYAADTIVNNIRAVEEKGNFDTMIIARGGGSIEDLWPFNEEKVARAIFSAKTPIISSIGHETDTTIADMVADVRAATPTAAAELAVPLLSEEILKIERTRLRLMQSYKWTVDRSNEHLNRALASYIFRQPQRLYEGYAQNVDQLTDKLNQTMMEKVREAKQQLQLHAVTLMSNDPSKHVQQKQTDLKELHNQLETQMDRYMKNQQKRLDYGIQSLDYLSPLKIMHRGYSYVTKDEKVIKSAEQVAIGESVSIHLDKGRIIAEVVEKEEETAE